MSTANILAILEVIGRLTERLSAYSALLKKVHAEGRDVTDADLVEFRAKDDEARVAETAAIEAAHAREGS